MVQLLILCLTSGHLSQKIQPGKNIVVHEKVECEGLRFEMWRDGQKIAANRYSQKGKVWQALRFDGTTSTFYQFDQNGKQTGMKTSKGMNGFGFAFANQKVPEMYSIDNLKVLESLFGDVDIQKKRAFNGDVHIQTKTPFSMFLVHFDEPNHRISEVAREDLSVFLSFKFDYPKRIDHKIFHPPITR